MLKHYCFQLWVNQLTLSTAITAFFASPVSAQIVPDNSLGSENSIVTPNVAVQDKIADLIEGGAIRGNNLFHSFEQFNVGDGTAVYFANPDGIANILTRVTGNNISEIFGTLGVLKDTASHIDGGANLFLLNPNGIVFGKNAALDVNGSFLATTAESYVFSNGLEYSATNPETAPLLTVNLTPGLQMGSNSGSITVQDDGHLITGGIFSPQTDHLGASGLEVKTGQTLGLIAKEINLDGGILKAPGGNIQLLGIEKGLVQFNHDLQSWQFDTSFVEAFGDLNLANRSWINTSGILTANIDLKAKNITLNDDSIIAIQNLGEQPSGKITLEATEKIELNGAIQDRFNKPLSPTAILTETLGNGKAGDIFVSGKNLFLANGGSIVTLSFSNGDTGNIDVDINELIEAKDSSQITPTYIGTTTLAQGNGGLVDISAKDINLVDGGIIGSANFGRGSGGGVRVNVAEDLKITNSNSQIDSTGFLSNIGSSAFSTGDSGSVIVNTARLSVENAGSIDTSSGAEGDAGTLNVNASEYINIVGRNSRTSLDSKISSDISPAEPIIRQLFGSPDVPSGNAGNVTLNTPSLIITNGGLVSVQNEGSGDGGSIQLNSDRVTLDSQGSITAFSASGQGGDIALNLQDSLFLRNGSTISAEARGTWSSDRYNLNGGNININADTVTLLENSSINANAFQGNGGNINITTQGLFRSPDSLITASSEYGLDGTVEIEEISGDRKFEFNQLPESIVDTTNLITPSCSASDNNTFAVIGNGGIPYSPYSNQSLSTTWYDLRPVKPEKSEIAALATPLQEATATIINSDGELELVALTPLSTHRWVKSSCGN